MKEVELSKQPVELYKILKFEGIAESGAAAKSAIAAGLVSVNDEIETRKRRKIVAGDIIEVGEHKILLYSARPNGITDDTFPST